MRVVAAVPRAADVDQAARRRNDAPDHADWIDIADAPLPREPRMIAPARLMMTRPNCVLALRAVAAIKSLAATASESSKTTCVLAYQAAETDGRATRVNAPLLRFSCAFDSVSKSTVNAWIGARTSAL